MRATVENNSVFTYRSFATTLSHNSKFVIFQEKRLKVSKCYNFYKCNDDTTVFPAAGFANCVMTLYPSKVNLQTFFSIPITQKCPILSCSNFVATERYTRVGPKVSGLTNILR
jgi:hypothetical protein